MITEEIKELLNSNTPDDISLGLAIARELNIDPIKINDFYDHYVKGDLNKEMKVQDIYNKYLEVVYPGYKGTHLWDYIKWK